MNKLFVHHPLFRLLGPLFSGTLVYLLILLINNTIEDLGANFFTQELYVCIGLAYIIQEASRLVIVLFNRLKRSKSFLVKSILHLVVTLLLSIVLVTSAMYLYFTTILSYTPNYTELLIFNSIFSTISVFYVLLYISNQFLFMVNMEKLEKEEWSRIKMEEDFAGFKRDINPELLLESLEAILVLMKKDPEAAESLTEDFASVYRYILSSKKKEVVGIEEELLVLNDFVQVLNQLPFRKIRLGKSNIKNTWVVPGSLLYICEHILRQSIPSEFDTILLDILEDEISISLKYKHQERIDKEYTISDLRLISENYAHYTSIPIEVAQKDDVKTIRLPKLNMQ